MRAAIDALPWEYRELILLRHYGELAYEEIAESKGMPLGTVKNKLFRARQMLKQTLAPGETGGRRGEEERWSTIATTSGSISPPTASSDESERAELDAPPRGVRRRAGASEASSPPVVARAGGSARRRCAPASPREVMAALEPAPWEARTLRAWRLPLRAPRSCVGGASAALLRHAARPSSIRAPARLGALRRRCADLFARRASSPAAASRPPRGAGSAVAIGDWLGGSRGQLVAALAPGRRRSTTSSSACCAPRRRARRRRARAAT